MSEHVKSKNWQGTQWESKKQVFVAPKRPNIVFPKIKDLPISKELALSKPIKLPEFTSRPGDNDEIYTDLSAMIRTNIFPGSGRAVSASSYSTTHCDLYADAGLYRPRMSAKDFRRKKQGFSKRLEHDLDYKRIQAAWKEYFENQKPVINWEIRNKSNTIRSRKDIKPKTVQPVRLKRKKPPPPPPDDSKEEPIIPSPDMEGMDLFNSNKTPDWAKGADSVPEELEEPMGNDEFWAFYDDPF